MAGPFLKHGELIRRHGVVELIEHWAIAVSGLLLILSGIFQLPIAKRYYITELPGFAWSGDYVTTLKLHYIMSVVFIAVSFFHVIYHGMLREKGMLPRSGDVKASIEVIKSFFGQGEEPPFGKYLPEQRVAYLGMAFIIGVLIISGLIKTYKNLIDPQISLSVVLWATWLHNIFFFLFLFAVIAHIAALIIKPNRPMVRGIFMGCVKLDYAKRRHPLWVDEVIKAVPASTGERESG